MSSDPTLAYDTHSTNRHAPGLPALPLELSGTLFVSIEDWQQCLLLVSHETLTHAHLQKLGRLHEKKVKLILVDDTLETG